MKTIFPKNAFTVIAIGLFCVSGTLSAQDANDNVLDQARAKYKTAQSSDNAAEALVNPTPTPQALAEPAQPTPTPVVQAEGGATTVAVIVQMPVVSPAASPSPSETPTLAAPGEKPQRVKAFSFQPFPGIPRRGATADVGVGIGLVANKVNSIRAVQLSLIGNIATESVIGFQGAGVFNITGKMTGLQSAGLVNVAGDVVGVQASGLINVAKKVKGLQIGLINISDEMDGLAIGLINYSKKGINEIPIWYGDNDFVYAGLEMGGRNAYVLLYGGSLTGDWFRYINSATVGASLGLRGKISHFYLQGDLGVKALVYPSGNSWHWTYRDCNDDTRVGSLEKPGFKAFGNFRLTAGFTIWGPFSFFAGINGDIDGGHYWQMPALYRTGWNFMFPGKELQANLSWIFGISL